MDLFGSGEALVEGSCKHSNQINTPPISLVHINKVQSIPCWCVLINLSFHKIQGTSWLARQQLHPSGTLLHGVNISTITISS